MKEGINFYNLEMALKLIQEICSEINVQGGKQI